MFATKLDLFSIETIIVATHTKHVPTLIYIPNLGIVELVQNQPIQLVDVLTVKLTTPLNIVKQHLFEKNFHVEVKEIIVDETLARERVQDLTIVGWIIIEDE
jgi:hypothetical protein